MHQYLLGHGYWSYVDGANDAAPEPTHRDFPTWEQSTQGIILLRIVCGRTTVELCSGCLDAEGCVGKYEEDFRCEYHNQEDVAQKLIAHTGCEAVENSTRHLFPGQEIFVC